MRKKLKVGDAFQWNSKWAVTPRGCNVYHVDSANVKSPAAYKMPPKTYYRITVLREGYGSAAQCNKKGETSNQSIRLIFQPNALYPQPKPIKLAIRPPGMGLATHRKIIPRKNDALPPKLWVV